VELQHRVFITAVKIAPNYSGAVIHVLDASRSVPVVSSLLNENEEERKKFVQSFKQEYLHLKKIMKRKNPRKAILRWKTPRKNRLKD